MKLCFYLVSVVGFAKLKLPENAGVVSSLEHVSAKKNTQLFTKLNTRVVLAC